MYAFYTTGSLDTKGYLLTEEQLSGFSDTRCLRYNDDIGETTNCYVKYALNKDDVVYFAVKVWDTYTGETEVHIGLDEFSYTTDMISEVTVSKTDSVSKEEVIKNTGDILLYKVTIQDAGAYAFYTSGYMHPEGYLLTEEQLCMYPSKESEDCIEYNYNAGSTGFGSSNFYMRHIFAAGDVVYLAVNEYGNNETGNLTVCMEYQDNYVEKDSICYEKIAGSHTWAVTGTTDENIKRAVISDKINGENVVKISEKAFYQLSDLSEVVIPEGIKIIDHLAFSESGLTEIKLPESCETINNWAFDSTNITKIHLPKNVKTIEVSTLPYALKEITVAEDNTTYQSIDGVLFSKDAKTLLRYPAAMATDVYTVPDGTETINENAFYLASGINRIKLPDSLKTIKKYAFNASSLYQIDCGDGLTTIETGAFNYCDNLKFIDLPQTIETIGDYAFAYSDSSDKEITIIIRNKDCLIGEDITDNRDGILYGDEDSTVKIYAEGKENVTFIPLTASGCASGTHQLKTVTTVLPTCETDGKEKQICLNCDHETAETTVLKLGHLEDDYRKNVCSRCMQIIHKDTIPCATLDQSVTIKETDFVKDGNSFGIAVYGFSLEKPGTYEISISDASLFDELASIIKLPADGSILDAEKITAKNIVVDEDEALWVMVRKNAEVYNAKISITCKHAATEDKTTPATCQEKGKVEKVCTSCGEVVYTMPIELIDHSITESNPVCTLCKVYAEKDGVGYKKIVGTNTWAVVKATDKGITKAAITDKINGESVVEISNDAFYGLSDLSEVVIPEGIKKIGTEAFKNTGLTAIKLPDSCETIDYAAFEGTAITKLHLPKNVKLIGVIRFPNMLKEITVAEDNAKYKSVDGVLFSKDGKTLLRYPPAKESAQYTVLNGTEIIGEYAFYNTTKLGQVILPDSLKWINEFAFFRSSLYQMNCGKNLTTIEREAFSYCDNLKFIDLPQTTTLIGERAFDVESGSYKEITIIIRNKDCEIKKDITANRKATLYGTEDSTAKTYAEGKDDVTFIALTSSGCAAGTHQLLTVETVPVTCETDGKEKQICLNCDYKTEETTVTRLGHKLDMAKNVCSRCMQIVNADTIQYVTLQQSVTIKEADFAENKTVFSGALYGVSLEKPGTYEFSISDESLFAMGIAFVKVPVNGNLMDAIPLEDKKVVLKKGEVLWVLATNKPSVYNAEISILCKHSTTEDKITPATCKESGKVEKVCASCEEVFETTLTEKTAHSFVDNKPACTVCGTPNPNYKPVDPGKKDPSDPSGSGETDPQAVRLGKMTLSASKVTYRGKEIKPSVTVTDTNGKTIDAANYTVTYSNNTNVGQAKVTVTGKNGCTGTLTAGFQIVPKGTKIAKITAKKKALTIKWKKQTKQTSGYELQVSTKKNFKGAKKVIVKKNKTTSVTVKKLKAKKKYYVRIRTYKTVKINGKNKKLYSNWSKAVTKKTK